MKLKLTSLFILLITISSCRKEFITHRASPLQKESPNSINPSTNIGEQMGLRSGLPAQGKSNALTSSTKKRNQIIDKNTEKKKAVENVPFSPLKEIQKKKEHSENEIKKEMNPRLSRALWMMIPGGLAVILGILLYPVAPTGLFIFAFSIVFLAGLVSLLLYLANPKPKM